MANKRYPNPERAVDLLCEYFVNRKDRVLIQSSRNKPISAIADGNIKDILRAHVYGDDAPAVEVRLSTRRRRGVEKGRFRTGGYALSESGTTRWLCVDVDGDGHADALENADTCAEAIMKAFQDRGLAVYLERSARGWHIWCFFLSPIPAKKARDIAFTLIPDNFPLAKGGVADCRKGRGIEVFPKQDKIDKRGVGSAVWLPFWFDAKDGASQFYLVDDDGEFQIYFPDKFETVAEDVVDQILGADQITEEKQSRKITDSEWDAWRKEALSRIPLESIYDELLTGERSGDEWLQCRDPDSPSGDKNPSAGVADGTGDFERGSFHSFISGKTITIFDFMIKQGIASDFNEAKQRIAELSGVFTPGGKDEPTVTNIAEPYRLPQIKINNRQMRYVVGDTWKAVRKKNEYRQSVEGKLPIVFRRSHSLVRIQKNSDGLCIVPMDESAVLGLMARSADWVQIYKDGIVNVSPVRNVAKDMIAYPHDKIPHLDSILSVPVFASDGILIDRPGYHDSEGVILELAEGFEIPPIPQKVTSEDIKAAKSILIDDLLLDFPFVNDADKAHAIAAFILPLVRRMIRGPCPLCLIEAPVPGSGKGLLSDLISIVATGLPCHAATLPTADDEARKMITAELSKGRSIVLLDNIETKNKLSSPPLASVLTSQIWTDRILGKSAMVTLLNKALWLGTANNPKLSMEIARRCVRIRIDPAIDRPWKRDGFKYPDIKEWALENRGGLVHAVLVLIKAWIDAERPLHYIRLGSFESWSSVIGGILNVAGIKGFLSNLDTLYEDADAEGQIWREFVQIWWEEHGDEPKKVAELNDLCEKFDLMVEIRGDGSEQSQRIRLGNALSGARDRVFNGYRIVKIHVGGAKRRGNPYQLVEEKGKSCTPYVHLNQGVQPCVHDVNYCGEEYKVKPCTPCTHKRNINTRGGNDSSNYSPYIGSTPLKSTRCTLNDVTYCDEGELRRVHPTLRCTQGVQGCTKASSERLDLAHLPDPSASPPKFDEENEKGER